MQINVFPDHFGPGIDGRQPGINGEKLQEMLARIYRYLKNSEPWSRTPNEMASDLYMMSACAQRLWNDMETICKEANDLNAEPAKRLVNVTIPEPPSPPMEKFAGSLVVQNDTERKTIEAIWARV